MKKVLHIWGAATFLIAGYLGIMAGHDFAVSTPDDMRHAWLWRCLGYTFSVLYSGGMFILALCLKDLDS